MPPNRGIFEHDGKVGAQAVVNCPVQQPEAQDHLVSRRALAHRWGVSVATIKRRERSGTLPVLRLGLRLIRYRIADIEQYEREAIDGPV